ncbi:unnamed protein product [Polarella glacialis]|uniref:Uncharacterized protein n=1 Tax=Polarella glacialis TaxID=89957 RepID=A0A813KHV6_POLGL|nr:unnamed protein product [Polarella glacialis]
MFVSVLGLGWEWDATLQGLRGAIGRVGCNWERHRSAPYVIMCCNLVLTDPGSAISYDPSAYGSLTLGSLKMGLGAVVGLFRTKVKWSGAASDNHNGDAYKGYGSDVGWCMVGLDGLLMTGERGHKPRCCKVQIVVVVVVVVVFVVVVFGVPNSLLL